MGEKYKIFRSLKDLEDKLAVKKMERIWKEVKQGKRKILSEQEVKKKYGFK